MGLNIIAAFILILICDNKYQVRNYIIIIYIVYRAIDQAILSTFAFLYTIKYYVYDKTKQKIMQIKKIR